MGFAFGEIVLKINSEQSTTLKEEWTEFGSLSRQTNHHKLSPSGATSFTKIIFTLVRGEHFTRVIENVL